MGGVTAGFRPRGHALADVARSQNGGSRATEVSNESHSTVDGNVRTLR